MKIKKTVVIGDTHGRTIWKDIVDENPDADKIVFLGDYLDTPNYNDIPNPHGELDNLNEIIRFKRANPDRVVLLIGNHDEHYLEHNVKKGIYTVRFQPDMVGHFGPLLHTLIDDGFIQVAYFQNEYIFSHAGITNTWMDENRVTEENINEKLQTDPDIFSYQFKGLDDDPSGNNIYQSPLWVRMPSLLVDGYNSETHIHIIGHTKVNEIQQFRHFCGVDALRIKKYLIIEGDELKMREVGSNETMPINKV